MGKSGDCRILKLRTVIKILFLIVDFWNETFIFFPGTTGFP